MKTLTLSLFAFAVSASSALAGEDDCLTNLTDPSCSTPVPEISALEGTAALAALAAIVLITWERRRRTM